MVDLLSVEFGDLWLSWRIDLYSGRHASDQSDPVGDLVDTYADRHALRQAYPPEDLNSFSFGAHRRELIH
jgi:hypothetical protein